MKRNLLTTSLLALLAFSGITAGAQDLPEQNNLSILTYNIHHGEGLDGRTDYARIGRLIRRSGADVVALQEVDSATRRSHGADVLRRIADEALMYPVFARSMAYDGGAYGVGLLCREHPLAVKRIPLPGSEEPRMLLVVEFKDYVVGCTHFSLTPADQLASLPLLRKAAEESRKPFFLAGDWNAVPTDSTMKALQRDFRLLNNTRNLTYPADKPERTIDYVAVWRPQAGRVATLGSWALNEKAASDHRPVLVRMRMLQPTDRVFYAQPYLQNPDADGVTVMFQTRVTAHAWVEYGTDSLHLQRAQMLVGGQVACHDIEHKIRLTGLTGGQPYYYRVCAREIADNQAYSKTFGDTVRTPFYRFTLPSDKTTDFTVMIMNDLHLVAADEEAMSRIAREVNPDFVVFNGDCLPEPHTRLDALRSVNRLATLFEGARRPIFFIRGNHEIRNAYSSGMPSLFDYPNPDGESYGAFSWGDTRFVMLDCGEDKPDDHWVYYGMNDFSAFRRAQADFLQQELKNKSFRRAARRVLLCHIPLWSEDVEYNPCQELWGPILQKAPFDVEVSAHTHRFAWHPAHSIGNPFPVCIGSGPGRAAYMLLEKRGKQLRLTVKNLKGEVLKQVEL